MYSRHDKIIGNHIVVIDDCINTDQNALILFLLELSFEINQCYNCIEHLIEKNE
jgi:hypothetical protein